MGHWAASAPEWPTCQLAASSSYRRLPPVPSPTGRHTRCRFKPWAIPHILEVDYPTDPEQHFGLSIVEPNAVDVIGGLHNATGVFAEGFGRSPQQKQTQRLLFWPRTQAPLLIVTNQHPSAAARFGAIRVLKSTGPLVATPPAPLKYERMVATYIGHPALRESFGASQAVTGEPDGTARCIDDYQTSYEVAKRLTDCVHYGGFNTAVVSAALPGNAQQATSQIVLNAPLEIGKAADLSRDTDTLELALRLFDREQLTFIPAIEFSTPIPRLEELRRTSDPQASGIELVGPDGRTWLQTHGTRRGLAPYYNLLDPRVQQAMLQVAQDLIGRYGRHAALGGLAVQLSGDGYAQLPTADWGLDDATISRFQQMTGIIIPAKGPERFRMRYEALVTQHSEAWHAWRTAQVTEFYAKLSAIICDNPNRRLLLTTERLLDHPTLADRVRPNLLAEDRVAETIAELGLDRRALERIPGLVYCPTLYVEPSTPLVDRAIDAELNAAFASWRQDPNVGHLGRPALSPSSGFAPNVLPAAQQTFVEGDG